MPLNTSTGQNTRAGAAAQALEAPTPSTSNMTAPQASSNTVVSDGHVYDSNEGNSAVGTHGANLTASEQSSMMEHGARNTLMRDAFGDNGGIEDKNGKEPLHNLSSIADAAPKRVSQFILMASMQGLDLTSLSLHFLIHSWRMNHHRQTKPPPAMLRTARRPMA